MDKTAQDVLDEALRRIHASTARPAPNAHHLSAASPDPAFQLYVNRNDRRREVKLVIGSAVRQGRISVGVLAVAAWEILKLLESLFH